MKIKLLLCSSLLSFLVSGCEDIFLRDISDERVAIISPADSTLPDGEKVVFSWDRMDGAEKYHIVVASPSLDGGSCLYDTITDTTRVEISLSAGKYQWSIYGYNSGYESKKTVRSFEVKGDDE